MGVFDRLERGLERAVKQPFARVFKAEVQPVEIASAMRDAMDDRAAVLGPGRTMVPNVFTIQLAETDHERLASYERALTDELVAAAEDHADAQRYVAPGPFEVRLTAGDDLETGIFRVAAAAKDGRPGRGGSRPDDRDRRDDRARRDDPRGRGPAAPRGREEQDDPHAAYRRPSDPRAGGEGGTRAFETQERQPARGRGPRPVLELDGRRIPLTQAVTVLGRDAQADVTLDDPGVSRRHAELRITHDGPHLQVILRDLGSTNGSYLNGEQVGSEELRNNDRLTMGRTHLIFRLEG
ncbi:FhaA domain-containing protein [Ornithinimicrobium panacihumi]|uniref:FhaA domain-containing protein n=1 Tax=Ornithinimicrobium panacihumi TaxID=2008449 RepID=UPI003F89DAD4